MVFGQGWRERGNGEFLLNGHRISVCMMRKFWRRRVVMVAQH